MAAGGGAVRTDRDHLVPHPRRPLPGPGHGHRASRPRPGHEGGVVLGQPVEPGIAVEAAIHDQQRPRRREGFQPVQEPLVIRRRVGVQPPLHRQFGSPVQDRFQGPPVDGPGPAAQQADPREQGFQRGAIDDPDRVEVRVDPDDDRGQGAPAGGRPRLQPWQQLAQEIGEQAGGRAAQAERARLLADLDRGRPQQPFARQPAAQLTDRRNLSPDHGQHHRDHDRQGQDARAQALPPIGVSQGEDLGADQVGQVRFDDRRCWGRGRARPGMVSVQGGGTATGCQGGPPERERAAHPSRMPHPTIAGHPSWCVNL